MRIIPQEYVIPYGQVVTRPAAGRASGAVPGRVFITTSPCYRQPSPANGSGGRSDRLQTKTMPDQKNAPTGKTAQPLRGGTFTPLRNRGFRLYWFGNLATHNSIQMSIVVRGWLVYTLTDNATALGLVAAAFGLPIAVGISLRRGGFGSGAQAKPDSVGPKPWAW